MSSEKLKLMIVILGVIAVIAIIGYFFPAVYMFLLVGYGLFVLGTLAKSWEHPKWYVKLYVAVCFFWEIFYVWACAWGAWGAIFGIAWALLLLTGVTLPLIPLWFLWYKESKLK